MILPLLFAILWLVPGSPGPPVLRLKLRDGRVYLLKEPPSLDGTRYVFKTVDGKVYSLDQSEVVSVGPVPRPTQGRARPNPQDSRALGAITRQQRERRGKSAEVAPRTTRRATRKPKPTPTPRPPSSPPSSQVIGTPPAA
ncbi:MAG TPA: hypothetical protein VLO07_02175 [Thermoanaerobaculia bacterium]|nr:hypothetical protein [Thermoanaerobaculia bacterium]